MQGRSQDLNIGGPRHQTKNDLIKTSRTLICMDDKVILQMRVPNNTFDRICRKWAILHVAM
uniref:Uncharacterized protein n=1 Tax=Setaria italica TaxID=4555 RepID=K4AHT9_SETIT